MAERNQNGKTGSSLLLRWFRSWQQLRAQGTISEASLDSNRKAGSDLHDIIDPSGAIPFDSIPQEVRHEILRQFEDEEDARAFFSEFRFRIDRPQLDVLEDGLIRRFFALGGTREGWLSLKDQLRLWVRERHEPSPDGAITVAVARAAANWNRLASLPEDFGVPDDYTLPSESFHEDFFRTIIQRTRGCQVLAAPPALGKSTYLSYLVDKLKEADYPVVRHHYFLRIGDRTHGRLDHSRIAESLMSELQGLYPDALGDLGSQNPSPVDLGKWLEQVGIRFVAEGKLLIVIIDGLDHVWREQDSRDELVRLFEHLLPAPQGVMVVVGTQPVDEAQLPPSLLRECPRDEWLHMEPLDLDAVGGWLHKNENRLDLPPDTWARQNTLDQLVSAFFAKTDGHPLHLRFVLASLLERGQGVNVQAIEDLPGAPGRDIMAYYSALWDSLPDDGRVILHLLACTNFPWPSSGFVEALDPGGMNIATVSSAVRQVRHLLTYTSVGYQAFHNSLLVFVMSHETYSSNAGAMRAKAQHWLTTAAPEYWRWAYSWLLDHQNGQASPLIEGPSREWAIDAIMRGYPRDQITEILGRSAWAALDKGQLGRFVQLAILKDNLEWQEHQALLDIQLALGKDTRLRDIALANADSLDSKDLVTLAQYEARLGNYGATKECLDALSRRSPRDAGADQVVKWAQRVITVAASLPDLELEKLVRFTLQFREHGRRTDVLDSLAGRMRVQENMAGLRALLTSPEFSPDEIVVIRTHTVGLALANDIQIGLDGIQTWNDPYSSVYRCLRASANESTPSPSYPLWSLLDRPRDTFPSRSLYHARFFKQAFYALLASNILEETTFVADWIGQATSPYVRDWLQRMNGLVIETVKAFHDKDYLPFSEPYRHFEDAERPRRWIGGSEDREAAEIADGLQLALSEITFDLVYLQRSWATPVEVNLADLQAALSSPFSDRWDWVASYLQQGRPFLPEITVTWLINELEGDTDLTIEVFYTQAERYAKLASLSVMHNRKSEEWERLLQKTVSNTIAYGFHKDMLIYSMLDIAEACQQAGIEGAEAWLLSLAPAVAHVDKFTDGDETRHFPQKLGESLALVAPDRLPDYYLWLSGHDEFFDARSVFNQIIRVADLSDPVFRAIVKTGLDSGSLYVLKERAEGGDSVAAGLYGEVIGLLGTPPENTEPALVRANTVQGGESTGDQPSACDYPPPNLVEFLGAGNATRPHETSDLIEEWLEFWEANEQGLGAYNAAKKLADSGREVRNGDLMARLARSYYGPAESYQWLVTATQDDMGWSQFYTSSERAQTRWTVIRDSYPDRWLQFIKDTITRNQNEPWSNISVQNHVLRLVEYCIALDHVDQAHDIAENVLSAINELTSPAALPSQIEWAGLAK